MSEEDKNRLPDDLFRDGLNQYQPEPGEGLWNRLQDNLHQEGRYHETDDLFHEGLSNYAPEPPGSVWSRLHENLETPAEFKLANRLSGYEPQPPHWVWSSLRFMLQKQRHQKIFARVAFAACLIGSISLFFFQNTPESLIALKTPKPNSGQDVSTPVTWSPATTSKNIQPTGRFSKPIFHASLISPVVETNQEISNQVSETPTNAIGPIAMFEDQLKNLNLAFSAQSTGSPVPVHIPKPSRKKGLKGGDIYLHFSAGADFVSGSVNATQGHEDYLNIRKASETNITTSSFYSGIEYRKGLISLNAGIRLASRGEDAVYNFKTYVQTSTDIQFFNQNSHTYFSVPYPYTLTYDHQKVTSNRVTSVEIPVTVGLNLKQGKWMLTPLAGVRAGLMVHSVGTMLSPVNDPTQLSLDEAGLDDYSRYIISADAGIRLGYRIMPNLSLTSGILYNQTLNNMFEHSSGIRQSYKTWNISGGIAWKL